MYLSIKLKQGSFMINFALSIFDKILWLLQNKTETNIQTLYTIIGYMIISIIVLFFSNLIAIAVRK
jgi:hypothetical protein